MYKCILLTFPVLIKMYFKSSNQSNVSKFPGKLLLDICIKCKSVLNSTTLATNPKLTDPGDEVTCAAMASK